MDKPTILVVDDNGQLREALKEALAVLGYHTVTAPSAEAAMKVLDHRAPDLILTDVRMGGMTGIDLCARLKQDPRFQLTPVILLTALSDRDERVAGLAAGADDFFAKPCDLLELGTRVAALLRSKSLLDQLERAESVITTLALTIEARDPHTAGHCERLAHYAVGLGKALGADETMVKSLRLGGYLHDLGKIAIPDRILLKPGPLDPAERAAIQSHAVVGADLVQGLRTLDRGRPIIRHHHERWNGSGYPDGLRGEGIPLGARIMGIVDVYDALRSARPHKGPLPHDDAVAILVEETRAGLWDPAITPAFVDVLEDMGPEPAPVRPSQTWGPLAALHGAP